MARGDFDVRVYNSSSDDMRILFENFNEMTSKLNDFFKQISMEKEKAQSILASIHEAVLVIDVEGKINNVNESFYKIFEINNSVIDRYYWEVIRDHAVIDLLRSTTNKNSNLTSELELLGKILICSTSYVKSKSEKILVFSDITKLRSVDSFKKDLVSNVSHELRTPLTAILGFLETIIDDRKEGIDDDIDRYIDTVYRHTQRTVNIVNDLLTISELDQKKAQISKSPFDLSASIQQMVRIFDDKLSKKALSLKLDMPSRLFINADRFKIEQVIVNLIDNAIKYTDIGGVRISTRKEGEFVYIDVEDSGIGIAKDSIARLFERFYVVDKSRSRKTGGTGLGLSIVKHIVLLHDGVITVDSEVGKGSRFVIKLPCV